MAEWAIPAPLPARHNPPRAPRKHGLRLVLTAILCILRGGEPWRLLPHEFPPRQSVYDHFRRWRQRGTWRHINDASRTRARLLLVALHNLMRHHQQSNRTHQRGGRGAGCGVRGTGLRWGKRIFGRKRHLVVGMQGLILHVHSADGHDRRAAEAVLAP